MKGSFNHIQYNIVSSEKTLSLFRDLRAYFEMETMYDDNGVLGIGDGHMSVWLMPPLDGKKTWDRDGPGLNHLGIYVDSREAVDRFHNEFMKPRAIEAAFDTPRARPEFSPNYYQVMFVDPEGLAIEVFTASRPPASS